MAEDCCNDCALIHFPDLLAARPASRIAAMPRGLSTIRPSSRSHRVCSDFAVRPAATHTHARTLTPDERTTEQQHRHWQSQTSRGMRVLWRSCYLCPALLPWPPRRLDLPCQVNVGSVRARRQTMASVWAYWDPLPPAWCTRSDRIEKKTTQIMCDTASFRWRTTRLFFSFFPALPALPPECLSFSPLARPVRVTFGFD